MPKNLQDAMISVRHRRDYCALQVLDVIYRTKEEKYGC